MAVDVLILTNGPGEVATWVKPVVQQLRKREPDHEQMRISVMLSPCPHASGGETDSLKSYPEVDRVQGPTDFFRFLLTGKTKADWDWHHDGVVVFLGGDQLYAVWAAKRLGYPTVIYAEWEPRWLNWVDRFGMMQGDTTGQIAEKYQPKLTVVGDLMADVESADVAELPFTAETQVIGLLPGSKPDKLRPGVPLSLAIAQTLHSQYPNIQFIIPVAPTVTLATLATYADPSQNATVAVMAGPKAKLITPDNGLAYFQIKDGPKVWLWTDFPAHGLLKRCQLCVTTVGANTAQLGSLAVPMVVLLPTQQLDVMRTWDGLWGLLCQLPVVGSLLTKVINTVAIQYIQRHQKRFAWPNIWAQDEVVPELLGRITAEEVCDRISTYLQYPEQLETMEQNLRNLRGPSGAARGFAQLILDTLDYPIKD
ncbi:lipid-a-disaccharide synthase [Leptolyngbya sp. Heron Island J]|uniref:lipid-A-disaccharide synthase n=1 Tax=Leptolyngbya sp. Heron Island J TaxID=1385935 RepID=UPI0003B9ADAD|nr:lipid-A-disaccharide synthase [Leptolyngbya sp. Heron Island J]ESA35693.1 lipid-a-disaccharide synthase [Leptolyngbya sp. Heron Island J]